MDGCMTAHEIERQDRRKNGRRLGAPLGPLALAAGLIGLVPGLAGAAPLPTCGQLGSVPAYGLVGNPKIVSGTLITAIIPPAPPQPANIVPSPPFGGTSPTPTPATPAYCQVDFTYASGLAGPADGYDLGQVQKIQIRIVLPLSEADGGSTGSVPNSFDGGSTPTTIQGNWLGKVFVSASPGTSGTIGMSPFGEGLNGGDQSYPIRLGYAGSMTDTGQHNPPFVLITSGPLANTLDKGTIADWAYRGTHYGKLWAERLSQTYYGKLPTRVYYNGISGGGNEGMGQLMHFGDEYDGIMIGAPAFYWDQFTLAYVWPYIVFKKMVQQGGTMPTLGQKTALTAAVFAACDALDGVTDGIINDPRQCDFKATANICGQPGAPAAPNCLTPLQAGAFDRMWDGPRNKYGLRVWFPFDKSIPFVGGPFTGLAAIQTSLPGPPFPLGGSIFLPLAVQSMTWNHLNASFDPNNVYEDEESLALAGHPSGGITYADEATLGSNTVADFTDNQTVDLSEALEHGTKVIHFHGTADPAIFWRTSADYYRRVATWLGHGKADFRKLQDWYRFFPIPDIGHGTGSAGGGPGPSPDNPFPALVKWAEKGEAPASITALASPPALSPGRTRPLCPYPQTAIYNGSGSTLVASSFHCDGNLETRSVVCDDARTVYKHENGPALDLEGIGLEPGQCKQHEANQGHDHEHD
jgi:Tannase and feruloyl esterase